MPYKNQQSFSTQNFSQLEIDVFDHINTIKTDADFNLIIDYFSIPPELQNHYTYFSLYYKIKHQNTIPFDSFIDDVLLKIRELLMKFEAELLLAKFHNISKIEHDNWVINNVFDNLNNTQNTYDIENHPLTKSKLLILKNEIEELRKNYLETKINTKINLRVTIIESIFNGIKDFFIGEEHKELYKVLNGKSLNKKLTFRGNQSQLAELFRRLKYNNELDSKYSEIEKWLCSNFKYSKGGKELNPNSIKEILLAKGNKDIAKSKRLLISEFPYKKPNQVKKEKEN